MSEHRLTGIRAWWHRRRYTNCLVCGREFRKGHGGGMSRSVVCSDACWAQAWREWLGPSSAEPAHGGEDA